MFVSTFLSEADCTVSKLLSSLPSPLFSRTGCSFDNNGFGSSSFSTGVAFSSAFDSFALPLIGLLLLFSPTVAFTTGCTRNSLDHLMKCSIKLGLAGCAVGKLLSSSPLPLFSRTVCSVDNAFGTSSFSSAVAFSSAREISISSAIDAFTSLVSPLFLLPSSSSSLSLSFCFTTKQVQQSRRLSAIRFSSNTMTATKNVI
mmetsp:Transcript_11182/g.21292  ORF Transcript_11182/g.21292 Transcript_11182/m.21292 type:complete len:200 (+) Transcript_11182:1301-1900(+)